MKSLSCEISDMLYFSIKTMFMRVISKKMAKTLTFETKIGN